MNKPEYIVLHTAAHGTPSHNYDSTRAQIDAWHKARGWKGIGYHRVVRLNGEIERGRQDKEQGAHTRGLNSRSIGICFSGHGDYHPWTEKQKISGLWLINILMKRFSIPPQNVIGHREAGSIRGVPDPHKTCPGKLIDMDVVRDSVRRERRSDANRKLKLTINLVLDSETSAEYLEMDETEQVIEDLLLDELIKDHPGIAEVDIVKADIVKVEDKQ
jgi:hypothetical protein